MELDLTDRRAVVTGASKGIGRAIAQQLAAEGCDLLLTARDGDALEALAAEIRDRDSVEVTTAIHDLATTDGQDALASDGAEADFLVNVAGAIPSGELDVLSDSD